MQTCTRFQQITHLHKAVFAVYQDAMEAQVPALMMRKIRADQTTCGNKVGGAIVPIKEGDFITELAREVLCEAELDDLQSLFADEMNVSYSPLGCPTEVSPILVSMQPLTWQEWIEKHQAGGRISGRGKPGKRGYSILWGQLSILDRSK